MSKNVVKSKKNKRRVPVGVIHIKADFNNTIITATDLVGNTLCWASSGSMKFKGSQKGTPYAAQVATDSVIKNAINNFAMKTVSIKLKGPGAGRESAIKMVQTAGLIVTSILDITSIPHGGCRPKKRRRI